jgi:LysR family transcriptional regulator, hydrogen peroxide-inducible genes activator
MELHQLRDFVAVANLGNFHEAAKHCHVAQPSLSRAIQRLEVEVGETLFVRTKRRVTLTPAGQLLYQRAKRIIAEIVEAKREVAETSGLRKGIVSVGVLPTIAPFFLPRAVSQFTEACPGVEIVIHEGTADDLLRLVENCELDLSIVTAPVKDDHLESRELFTEQLLLTVPSNHLLAVKEDVRLVDLDKERFILMKDGPHPGDYIVKFCQDNGVVPQIVLRSSQIETIQSLIMAGLGISLIPQMAKINGRIPLVYRPLDKPKPTRTVGVVLRKGKPPTRGAGEFLKHLEQTAKAYRETLPP